MNYSNVAYNLLSYKMALATLTIQSYSKWHHCQPMYTSTTGHNHCWSSQYTEMTWTGVMGRDRKGRNGRTNQICQRTPKQGKHN